MTRFLAGMVLFLDILLVPLPSRLDTPMNQITFPFRGGIACNVFTADYQLRCSWHLFGVSSPPASDGLQRLVFFLFRCCVLDVAELLIFFR